MSRGRQLFVSESRRLPWTETLTGTSTSSNGNSWQLHCPGVHDHGFSEPCERGRICQRGLGGATGLGGESYGTSASTPGVPSLTWARPRHSHGPSRHVTRSAGAGGNLAGPGG